MHFGYIDPHFSTDTCDPEISFQMMRLPKFEFLAPETVDEAAKLLDKKGGKARLLAGGTDLLPSMKNKLFTPDFLISLNRIKEMHTLDFDPKKGLRLGALATLSEIGRDKTIAAHYPVLAETARKVATPILQNKGTIGGNILLDTRCYYYNQSHFWRMALGGCMKKEADICRVAPSGHQCYAISSADTPPVLMAYDAEVTLVSAKGERVLPLKDFYENDGMKFNKIEENEILTEVRLPVPPRSFRGAYLKLRRRQAIDYPMLGVMVGLTKDKKGVCTDARVILTAIFSAPYIVESAQKTLIGNVIGAKEIEEAAELAYNEARPLDLTNFKPLYRKRMVRVFVKRALEALVHGNGAVEDVLT